MNHFNFNGKIFKEGTAIVSPDNRGLRYGDGLFETMKIINGRLLMADDHFARLWKGLSVLAFDVPKHFSPEKLSAEILALAAKNNHFQAARVRLSLFRGDGGLYDAKTHTPNYSIQTWPLPEGCGEWNSNGMVTGVYKEVRKSCDILSNLKHNNFLPYAMAALHAKKEKWNDALLLNSQGNICDSSIANIFIVKDGDLFTPALSEGCVAGVMRGKIIHELKNSPWPVKETAITIGALLDADEVFLSNCIHNIRWVQAVDNATYANTISQKIAAVIVPTIL